MKLFLALLATLVLAYGSEIPEPKHLGLKATDIASEETLAKLVEALKKFSQDGDTSGIFNLEMNSMIDELLNDLRNIIIRQGLDPMNLEDETLQLLGIVGSMKLTNGWLQDLSTILRYEDIIVSYNSANKTITFLMPLSFRDLLFTYDYVTRVLLFSVSGDVHGKIVDVHMDLTLTYDAVNGFILDNINMKDSGKVTIEFTGNHLVDWLTNAMTACITTVLHPLIVKILQSNVESIGKEVVVAINDYIKNYGITL
ncbi:uncharacterized protein [Euwallacea fornicatus]|uniref:uncharacterized protein n=1 Tax=Euwallacea fornicatus TaxID=995702 RepID=UPI00338E6405